MVRSYCSLLKRSAITAMLLVGGIGCSSGDTTTAPATKTSHVRADHPEKGPHQGALIELGDEEYHAELVHDEKQDTVTIYILDSAATDAVPIEMDTITIHVRGKGGSQKFPLKADRIDGEPEGTSSRFSSSDEKLHQAIDAKGAEARLQLTINGQSYSGDLPHDHGHSHKH